MKRILVIDNEAMILDALQFILEDLGHAVTVCSDARAGMAEAVRGDYDLILVDLRMPSLNGARVTEAILAARPGAKVVILAAWPNDPQAALAVKSGAAGIIMKPFEIENIVGFLEDSPGEDQPSS